MLNGVNMDVIDIIKDSFIFPSKDMKTLLIYVLLSLIAGAFSFIGILVYILGFVQPECFMWGGMAIVVSMLIGWVMYGYSVSVIKSGIDLSDEVPKFEWWENFIIGFDNFIVTIVYFLIPAFITLIVGYMTNIYGNLFIVGREIYLQTHYAYMGSSSAVAFNTISQALANLVVSLAITLTAALVIFVIFSFLQTMAEARLANTGSLSEALNVFEAAKDIGRIGIGKVIILIILVIVVTGVVEMVFSALFNIVPILSILSIIVTPYLLFFAQRAVGLLYSDIA